MFSANVPLILVLTGCAALLAGLFGGIKTKDIEVPTLARTPRIVSSLVGVLLIGAAMWLYIRPSGPPVPPPTQTPEPVSSATFTPLPETTGTAAPTAATAAATASATPIVPDPTNPVGFLRYYFNLLTDSRNYGDAWKLLTRKYQRQFYSGNYTSYGSYWGAVAHVNLESVQITQLTAASVNAHVQMTLIMTSGLVEPLTADYHLIYDPNARTWMFDTP
jgi:hypothetical protein